MVENPYIQECFFFFKFPSPETIGNNVKSYYTFRGYCSSISVVKTSIVTLLHTSVSRLGGS